MIRQLEALREDGAATAVEASQHHAYLVLVGLNRILVGCGREVGQS